MKLLRDLTSEKGFNDSIRQKSLSNQEVSLSIEIQPFEKPEILINLDRKNADHFSFF
jgi:hypothetical protein